MLKGTPRSVFIFAAVIVCAFAAASLQFGKIRSAPGAEPRDVTWLLEAPPLVDAGVVARGADALFSFPISNPTSEEVDVTRVATTCGCTSANIDVNTLAPGQQGLVNGFLGAPEVASGFQVRVALVRGEEQLSSTYVKVRSVDPFPSQINKASVGEIVLSFHEVYDPSLYEWKVYARRNDSVLPSAVESTDAGEVLRIQAPPLDSDIVVIFTETYGGKSRRFSQRIEVAG